MLASGHLHESQHGLELHTTFHSKEATVYTRVLNFCPPDAVWTSAPTTPGKHKQRLGVLGVLVPQTFSGP